MSLNQNVMSNVFSVKFGNRHCPHAVRILFGDKFNETRQMNSPKNEWNFKSVENDSTLIVRQWTLLYRILRSGLIYFLERRLLPKYITIKKMDGTRKIIMAKVRHLGVAYANANGFATLSSFTVSFTLTPHPSIAPALHVLPSLHFSRTTL